MTNDAQGNEDILVVELLDPSYDAGAGTVTYGVNILSDYEGGLDFAANRQQDEDLAPSFGSASLFIDDCANQTVTCVNYDGERRLLIPNSTVGFCWNWSDACCAPCAGYAALVQGCNDYNNDGEWCTNWGNSCTVEFDDGDIATCPTIHN